MPNLNPSINDINPCLSPLSGIVMYKLPQRSIAGRKPGRMRNAILTPSHLVGRRRGRRRVLVSTLAGGRSLGKIGEDEGIWLDGCDL